MSDLTVSGLPTVNSAWYWMREADNRQNTGHILFVNVAMSHVFLFFSMVSGHREFIVRLLTSIIWDNWCSNSVRTTDLSLQPKRFVCFFGSPIFTSCSLLRFLASLRVRVQLCRAGYLWSDLVVQRAVMFLLLFCHMGNVVGGACEKASLSYL